MTAEKPELSLTRWLFAVAIVLFVCSPISAQNVAVTGHVHKPDGSAQVGATKVIFDLAYCGANQAKVTGTGHIPNPHLEWTVGNGISSTGTIAGHIYGNDEITCGVTTGNNRWRVSFSVNNQTTPACELNVTGSALDLDTAVCDTVAPVVVAPTGDTTYARKDGGNTPFTGPIRALALNSVRYADTYGSIDAAATACGSDQCTVVIPSNYIGAESANLVATTDGYHVYCGPSNITVLDMRANVSTPLTPTASPLYSILYGGRIEGQEIKLGANHCASSPDDSVASSTSFTWSTGTYPSNSGTINGTVSAVISHGAVTVGASNSAIVANDAEVYLSTSSADHSAQRISAFSGQVGIRRAGGVQGAKAASVFWAHSCINSSGSGAILVDCYGVDAQGSSAAAGRNFAYHSSGNWLTENGTAWYAGKLGTAWVISAATESAQTVTITTSAPCDLTTNQHVTISGVTNSSYNGDFTVLTPGCNGGSTFTYTDFGTNNLSSSSGGTATGVTPQLVTQWSGANVIYKPLADASGWAWQTQAGGSLLSLNSSALTIGVNTVTPVSAANAYLGSTPLPFAGLIIGNAAGNTVQVSGTFTANRTLAVQDVSGTLPVLIASGTSTLTSGSVTTNTCQTAITTAATNAATTDAIEWSYATAPGTADGLMHVSPYVTANNVNFTRCNATNASQTGTAIVINWRVMR